MTADASSVLQIVSTIIFVLAIPWAMRVARELGEIRTLLEGMAWQEKAITNLQDEVTELKIRLPKAK